MTSSSSSGWRMGLNRFCNLPVTLVRIVVEDLSSSDLLALCLTCRTLKTIATPVLYRDVWFREVVHDGHGIFIDSIRLPQLVETLLLRPDLGQMVESFKCGPIIPHYWHAHDASWIRRDHVRLKLKEFLQDTLESERIWRRWRKLLNDSVLNEELLPFSLLHMPNLRALEVRSTNPLVWQYIREIIDTSLSAEPSTIEKGWLSQLELLCMPDDPVSPRAPDYGYSLDTILAFSRLPSFKHLEIRVKGCTADIFRPPRLITWETQVLYRMKSLEVYTSFCLCGGQELRTFLWACVGLQVLRYHPQESWRSLWLVPAQAGIPYEQNWRLPYMFNQLPNLGLKVLSVRKQYGEPLTVPLDLSMFTSVERLEIGLLFIFHSQKELQIDSAVPLRSLWAPPVTERDLAMAENRLVEVLPGSLKDVVFTGCGDRPAACYLNRALLVMLQRREQRFPHLRSVDCWRDDHAPRGEYMSDVYLDALEEAFAFARRVGVAVKATRRTKHPWGSTDEMWSQREREIHSPLALRNRLNQLNWLCNEYKATGSR